MTSPHLKSDFINQIGKPSLRLRHFTYAHLNSKMRPFLDKSLSPASKTLEHLLLEIDRQIALLIREQGSPEDKPENGIIALQEQDDTYRENLANLHAQILGASPSWVRYSLHCLTPTSCRWCVTGDRLSPAGEGPSLEDPDILCDRFQVGFYWSWLYEGTMYEDTIYTRGRGITRRYDLEGSWTSRMGFGRDIICPARTR